MALFSLIWMTDLPWTGCMDVIPGAALAVAGLAHRQDTQSADCSLAGHAMRFIRGESLKAGWRFIVGRLLEVPGVFSQGETMEELRENIQDAYDLMVSQERSPAPGSAQQQRSSWKYETASLHPRACILVRHGKRHDVYQNPATNRRAPVPRHREIAETLCAVICKQLGLV